MPSKRRPAMGATRRVHHHRLCRSRRRSRRRFTMTNEDLVVYACTSNMRATRHACELVTSRLALQAAPFRKSQGRCSG